MAQAELQLLSRSPLATLGLGRVIGERLEAGALISLDGDLGTGKTVFVQGLAVGLGVSEPVTSPTFTLMKEYEGRLTLYHYDAWMEGRERAFLEGGGDEALLAGGVGAVEWGSRVSDHFPAPYLRIELAHVGTDDPDSRRISIAVAPAGARDQPLLELVAGLTPCPDVPELEACP